MDMNAGGPVSPEAVKTSVGNPGAVTVIVLSPTAESSVQAVTVATPCASVMTVLPPGGTEPKPAVTLNVTLTRGTGVSFSVVTLTDGRIAFGTATPAVALKVTGPTAAMLVG